MVFPRVIPKIHSESVVPFTSKLKTVVRRLDFDESESEMEEEISNPLDYLSFF